MKDDRPHLRFWVVGMSGTLINSDPLDTQATADIIGSPAWNDTIYPHHALFSEKLEQMKKVIDKGQSLCKGSSPNILEKADLAIRLFAANLPSILVR